MALSGLTQTALGFHAYHQTTKRWGRFSSRPRNKIPEFERNSLRRPFVVTDWVFLSGFCKGDPMSLHVEPALSLQGIVGCLSAQGAIGGTLTITKGVVGSHTAERRAATKGFFQPIPQPRPTSRQ